MGIDNSQVTVLAAKLERLPFELQAALRTVVRAGAVSVAEQAKANAAFSSRIPGAISVRSSSGLLSGITATVRVSAVRAPEAWVLEMGNANSSSTTSFRHPVYGRDTWVTQPMRPFLGPAMQSKSLGIRDGIIAAIEATSKGL